MKSMQKALAIGASSAIVLSGVVPALAAEPSQIDAAEENAIQENLSTASSQYRELDTVRGTFSFSQTIIDSTDSIKKNIAAASKYLCGSQPIATAETAPADWEITVRGDVSNPYTVTFGELVESGEVSNQIIGCSCASNPTDGAASVNAEVTGVSARYLIDRAQPSAEVNTVVFASADGYEVALPLYYLYMRHCPISFNVNGAELVDSVGGTNQLWLGSTPASYFARDIVSVTLEQRETPPADPTSDEARGSLGNLPNIGIMFGGDIA